ncbi:unnamed protein product, partial [Rotaria sordida]
DKHIQQDNQPVKLTRQQPIEYFSEILKNILNKAESNMYF